MNGWLGHTKKRRGGGALSSEFKAFQSMVIVGSWIQFLCGREDAG